MLVWPRSLGIIIVMMEREMSFEQSQVLPRVAQRSLWKQPPIFAWLIIAALLLSRLVVAPWVVLIPEETYYWMYAKYPALGYLDHPPMVAWIIGVGANVLGDSELGVRIGTWLLTVGSTWVCYRLAADWCGRRAGWVAALLFSIAPLLFSAGFLAMPDAPLVCFWLAALLAITRAYRRDALGWWLVAGAATGLAFMAKYPAAFIAVGTLLFLLSDARGRAMLRRPGVWLGLAVAIVVASPVLWWNARHDWSSFRFQFGRRADQHVGLNPLQAFQSLAVQFLVLSPLIFALLLGALWVGLRRFGRDVVGSWRFAVCFSAPWLAVCVYHGLFAEIRMNWPIPAYLSLLPASAILLRSRALPLLRRLAPIRAQRLLPHYAGVMLAANVVLVLVILGRIPLVPTPHAFVRWDELGHAAEVAEEEFHAEAGSEPFILADGRYNLASELGFYMRDPGDDGDWRDVMPLTTAVGGGLNYIHWRAADEFLGRNAIFVTSGAKPAKLAALRSAFESIDDPQPLVTLARGGGKQVNYWVIRCHCLLELPSQTMRAAGAAHAAGTLVAGNQGAHPLGLEHGMALACLARFCDRLHIRREWSSISLLSSVKRHLTLPHGD
jgi:dolichol-phosphate mannosyltransferase